MMEAHSELLHTKDTTAVQIPILEAVEKMFLVVEELVLQVVVMVE
jgi:hypothetical protein